MRVQQSALHPGTLLGFRYSCDIHLCVILYANINCICNTDLWGNLSCGNIVQFVTYVVQRMRLFGKIIQCPLPILFVIPSPYVISLFLFWATSHSHFSSLGRCATVFLIYRLWHEINRPSRRWIPDNNLMPADKSTSEKPCFCFGIKTIMPF